MKIRTLALILLGAVLSVGSVRAAVSQQDGRPAGPSGELTVLSYNVAGLPELLSGSEPATNSPLISPLLNAYDLVLLQENWADDAGAGLLGYHHLIVAAADHPHQSVPAANPLGLDLRRPGALQADGLNQLSRFPFGPLDRQRWDRCNGELPVAVLEEIIDVVGLDDLPLLEDVDGGSADCGALKGFSMARTVLAPGVEVDVYNLHADAGSGPGDLAVKADNFRQLAAYLTRHSQGRAVILGGDTNLRASRDVGVWDGFLAATGLVDACQLVDCGADGDIIDKIAVRSGGGVELAVLSHRFERDRFRRADGQPLSDHDALAVRVRWQLDAAVSPDGPGADPALGTPSAQGTTVTLPATR